MSEERQKKPRVRRAGAKTADDASRQETRPQRLDGPPPSVGGGGIRIEDTVVAKVVGLAVHEVDGVRAGGGTPRSVAGLLSSAGGGEPSGISVEVSEVEAAADVTLAVAYGMPIPQISEAVRRNVVNRVENLVGLRVTEVNIAVNDLFFPEQERQQQQSQGDGGL